MVSSKDIIKELKFSNQFDGVEAEVTGGVFKKYALWFNGVIVSLSDSKQAIANKLNKLIVKYNLIEGAL